MNLDEFEEILLQHQQHKFLVVDPLGGKGDQLIYLGMERKLKELDINYTVLRYKTAHARFYKIKKMLSSLHFLESSTKTFEQITDATCDLIYKKLSKLRAGFADVVLLRGGAYLNDVWKEYKILENAIRDNPNCNIIVAPQSFFFNTTYFPEFFENTMQEIDLFCRERYSYNLLCSMNFPENVHIHLSHDTALYLSKDDFNPQNGSYDLICPRGDRESVVDWRIQDLSKQKNMELINSEQPVNKAIVGDIDLVTDFQAFANLIENSKRVYTDRLHVAILSAILGKDTLLYPNIYHKNRGVYEFSLHKFPNVRFVDSLTFLGQKVPV